MGKTITRATSGDDVFKVIGRIIDEAHQDLKECGALIAVLFVESSTGPAIISGGYPVRAKVKLTTAKDRALVSGRDRYDVLLMIDWRVWEDCEPSEREALIDHELSHVVVVRDDGRIESHDDGRPKLRLRPGDWNIGDGFAAVVRRRGSAAPEYQNLITVVRAMDEHGQYLFEFAEAIPSEFSPRRELVLESEPEDESTEDQSESSASKRTAGAA